MYHYKRDFYDFFTDKSIFSHFCSEINCCNADVFVLMAHKAVRLFQVLLDQGKLNERIGEKIIISSQALDYDCRYLLNKKIVIIDDVVISGASLAGAVDKLLNIGIPEDNIEIIALARDKEYQTMLFTNKDGQNILHCDAVLDDSTCIELSNNISKAFSFYGTPYDIDYPIYESIDLTSNKIQLLFNKMLWRTESTTNLDQEAGDVAPYILFPTQNVLEILWRKIGFDLSDSAHLKIRVYVRRYLSGREECSIVPMCLFNEISEKDLEILYSNLAPKSQTIIPNKDRLLLAQMRYVEYYIAHQMYLVFCELSSLNMVITPSEFSVNLLFGLSDGKKIFEFISKNPPQREKLSAINSKAYIDKEMLREFLNHKIGREMVHNIAMASDLEPEEQKNWINQIVLAPFLWWHDTQEILVRKKIMATPKHYIKDYKEIQDTPNRSRCGFSLRTMQYLLNEDLHNEDSLLCVSLFLDHAIDRGIIVPTIYHNSSEHYLCRAYRHGEDLPFSIEDECRLAYFLLELCNRIPEIDKTPTATPLAEGISKIAFEKMIVIFYQMGLKMGGVFNHFLGFNNIRILKPFLSLHGAIQAFVDPETIKELNIGETHFYSEKDPKSGAPYIIWLTNWAKLKGFAWNPPKNDGEDSSDFFLNSKILQDFLKYNVRSCISNTIAAKISDIASIVVTWYQKMLESNQKTKFKDDATALTSCSNAYVFVSAIATELHYYYKFWQNQVIKAIDLSDNFEELKYNLSADKNDAKYVKEIIQALHSGRKKTDWFATGHASQVVDYVSNILKNSGASIWETVWGEVRRIPYSMRLELEKYKQQAISFLYFYSACNDCLTYAPFWITGETPDFYEEYQEKYMLESTSVRTELEKEWFSELHKVSKITDFKEKKEKFYDLVITALNISEDLVKNIEEEIETHAEYYSVCYISSLIFEVDAINPPCVEQKMMQLWNQQSDLQKKTELNIIQFPSNKDEPNYIRYGLFYGISSDTENILSKINESGHILLSLYTQLCHLLNGYVNGIRVIFLPQTPVHNMFRHNVQRKIDENAKKFTSRVIRDLQKEYAPNKTNQIVVAMTENVDKQILKDIESLGWDHQTDCSHSAMNPAYSQIVTFTNDRIVPSTNSILEAITFSTVALQCGEHFGVGLLVRTKNRVVCVTCNHLLSKYNDDMEIKALSNNGISFKLKPLRSTRITNGPKTASEDVAILEPLWDIKIPYDVQSLLTTDALNTELTKDINDICQCYVCINGENLVWKNNLVLRGPIGNEYYQIDTPKNVLKSGCSGGVIITNPQNPTILGIHKGCITDIANGEDKYPQMIPCPIIIKEIRKVEENT